MNATIFLLLGFLAQAAVPAAKAQDKAKAKALLAEGTDLYERGDFAAALEKFRAAYAAYDSPKLLFNIGQANRYLGRPVEAVEALEGFLAGAADAADATVAETRKAVGELQAKLGRIRIECVTADATISLDGKEVGRTPLPKPLWAAPGRHQVTARHVNSTPDIEDVDVKAGSVANVLIMLQPAQSPVLVLPAARSEHSLELAASPITNTRSAEPSDGWWLGRKWTWVAAGAAVAFTAGAAIAGTAMQSKFDSLNSSCGIGSTQRQGCTQSDLGALNTRRDTANVMWVLAGASAVTAGALFYFEGRPVTVAPLAGETTGLLASVRY